MRMRRRRPLAVLWSSGKELASSDAISLVADLSKLALASRGKPPLRRWPLCGTPGGLTHPPAPSSPKDLEGCICHNLRRWDRRHNNAAGQRHGFTTALKVANSEGWLDIFVRDVGELRVLH